MKKPARKPAAKPTRTPAKKRPAAAPRHAMQRQDYGAPIDGFFAKQSPELRPILEELRQLVEAAAPDARSAIKWGMPFYSIGHAMLCALGAHRAHVNLILSGPPGAFADPKGRLEGEGKTGRHLKLTSLAELPRADVKRWLKVAAEIARKKA